MENKNNVTQNTEPKKSLEQLASEWFLKKKEADKVQMEADSLKNELFERMNEEECKKIHTDICTVGMYERRSEKMDEQSVMAYLESIKVTDSIKQAPYIDLTILEDGIRRGEINPEEIEKRITTTTSRYITVRGVK